MISQATEGGGGGGGGETILYLKLNNLFLKYF